MPPNRRTEYEKFLDFVEAQLWPVLMVLVVVLNVIFCFVSHRWWCFYLCQFSGVGISTGTEFTYGIVPTSILSVPFSVSANIFAPDMCELTCGQFFNANASVVGEVPDSGIHENCTVVRNNGVVHPKMIREMWQELYPDQDAYTCESRMAYQDVTRVERAKWVTVHPDILNPERENHPERKSNNNDDPSNTEKPVAGYSKPTWKQP